jgi:predicted small lipoprotein YifL
MTGSEQHRRWPELALALALAAALSGCGLRGPTYGKVSPKRSSPGSTSDYQGSFVYPSVGEYDGERVRNSSPNQILNSAYENNY